MKKAIFTKYISLAVCTLLLTATVFFALYCSSDAENGAEYGDNIAFSVRVGGKKHPITYWNHNGIACFCIPSCAGMADVALENTVGKTVLLDGRPVPGNTLDGFSFNELYTLTVDDRTAPLFFFHSANVSAMFVNTKTPRNMSEVNADASKKTTAKVQITLLDADGAVTYADSDFQDTIKGHGNSTWTAEKKPYNLKLKRPAALIGGEAHSNYVLLANALDKSGLRNRVMYDLAAETMDGWNVSCKHTDLYINGEYRGLYLLVDKVEVSADKLDLPHDCPVYNLETTNRTSGHAIWDLMPGISAELQNGDKYSQPERIANKDRIREIFGKILNYTVSDRELCTVIDMDSWASLYICQEFSANYDSGTCSLYFYLRNGKLYAGPLWDYDNTFGLRKEFQANGFAAKVKTDAYLWRSLTAYDSFNRRVAALYERKFRPQIEKLVDGRYAELAATIKDSVGIDCLRWRSIDLAAFDVVQAPYIDDFSAFIEKRLKFLDNAWIKETEYHTVFIDMDTYTICVSVKDNATGKSVKRYLTDNVPAGMTVIDTATGKVFDPKARIRDNVFLALVENDAPEENAPDAETTPKDKGGDVHGK